MQKEDFGDNTNYVATLAGELLSQASLLIRTGVHPSAIISGFELALTKTEEILKKCIALDVKEMTNNKVLNILQSTLASKIP